MIALLITVLLIATAAGLVLAVPLRADRIVRDHVRRNVLVTCKDGSAFRGVLDEADERSITLREAIAVSESGGHVGVDGVVLVLRADVAYMQFP